jgi:hypothetical protein
VVVSFAIAEDISFEASVDAQRVAMGSAIQLTLTVHGAQDVNELSLPEMDGFETRYVGPSTQVQVINGEYTTSKAMTYMLLPQKEGIFTIPALQISIKGKAYTSRPISVDVLPVSADPANEGINPGAQTDTEQIGDRVHMYIVIPEKVAYVNQEIPLKIKLFVRDTPLQIASLTQFDHEGLNLSEFSSPKQYQESLDGKMYEVVEYSARLKPMRDGVLNLGPAILAGNLVVKDNVRRNPFGGNGFNDDFFAGFFNAYQKKPVTITSQPVILTVKALPSEGKPADFSGGVGNFTFDVSVSPLKVKAGDPVTIKMSVAGGGDLKMVKMPEVKSDQFKSYDPQVKEIEGQKTLEQVVLPTKEGDLDLPAVTFSYFDAQTGHYVSLTRGPFSIKVLPMEHGQEFQAVGFADRPSMLVKENLGNDIVFIKDQPGRLLKKKGWVARNGLLLTVCIIYLNVWGLLYGIHLYRRKLSEDPGFARRSVAMKAARAAMRDIQPLIVNNGSKLFYSHLSRIFNDYLEKKFNILPSNTDFVLVETALAVKKLSEKNMVLLKEIYDLAERARLASASVSVEEMRRSLFDMEEVLDEIERRAR